MGAVQAGSELGADAFGQFGGAEALDGVLGHLALPLRGDGGRVDERYPVDDLGAGARAEVSASSTGATPRASSCRSIGDPTCLICSQKSFVTEDPDWKVTSTW